MPNKGRVTAKDYPEPLRKPGEQCEPATAKEDDGAQKSASSVNESENVAKLPADKAIESLVKDTPSSQVSEEKPTDKTINTQEESVEENTVAKNTEKASEVTVTKEEGDAANSTKNDNLDVKETQDKTTLKDEVSKTKLTDKVTSLSPYAQEFVPKSTISPQSVDAAEFVPGALFYESKRPNLLERESDTPENELMNCVKDVLFGLYQSPGELYFYFSTLVRMLKKWLSSLDSLKDVVDLIFEFSATERNFQYITAKLCNMLSKERSIEPAKGEKFRSVFMNRCKDEHIKREERFQNPETEERLLGFAMFEAELFCHYRPLGETEPLKVFHRGLVEMLNTLLQSSKEEFLTCIGNILKMTGYLLDDPRFMKEDKDRKGKVDKIFTDVERLSKESNLSESVKSLLSQVIELRASKWDNGLEQNASYPTEDTSYYLPDFSGLVVEELNLDDDLIPVTNPDQWSDYYPDEDDMGLFNGTYDYYSPEEYDQDYSNLGGEEGDFDPAYYDEIDAEFEKFLQEQDD